jgi:hypothetical protein
VIDSVLIFIIKKFFQEGAYWIDLTESRQKWWPLLIKLLTFRRRTLLNGVTYFMCMQNYWKSSAIKDCCV